MKLFENIWSIAIRANILSTDLPAGQDRFSLIKNPWWGWAADPFLFEHNGQYYLFAELFSFFKQKGYIGFSQWDGKQFGPWKIVIKESCHLSYPNIFNYEGNIYICPESNQSNSVYLYKAIEFPYRWEKEAPFIQNKKLSDTTFYKKDDTIYGFSSQGSDSLLLFKTDDYKEVEMSPDNPVKKDSFSARPGGGIIYGKDHDYRVSQDCGLCYGHGIVFSNMSLDWPHYSEQEVLRWESNTLSIPGIKKILGIHTYNKNDKFEVIDVNSNKFSFLGIVGKIIYKCRHLF